MDVFRDNTLWKSRHLFFLPFGFGRSGNEKPQYTEPASQFLQDISSWGVLGEGGGSKNTQIKPNPKSTKSKQNSNNKIN